MTGLKYRSAIIYFSSGTGNSYRLAKWFDEACQKRAVLSVLVPVNLGAPEKEILASPDQLIVLAFPTHGFLPPWSVIKFLLRMPRRKRANFLCLPTRGSLYIGPVLIPGAAGLASFLPALILLFKGFRPKGAVSFDMPVNITSIHPSLTPRHANRVIAAAKRKSDRYFERFFRTNSLWLTGNNIYEFVWSFLILYFVPLFPVLYLIIGRFFMGKMMFATNRCVGCGTCAKSCPTGALVMKGKKVKRPYWNHNCEHCLRCLNYCPHHAVAAGLAWAALLWFICVSVAAGSSLFSWFTGFVPQLQYVRNWWTVELMNAIFYYPAIVVAYFLFYQLIRFRPLNTLFAYTSLNPYLGQYRAPQTALKDFGGQKANT